MSNDTLTSMPIWKKLRDYAAVIKRPGKHLKHLITKSDRLETCTAKCSDLLLDWSRQRVDPQAASLLIEFAAERGVADRFGEMMAGKKVNTTENRAALHTACRLFSSRPIRVDERDILVDIRQVRQKIKRFSESVGNGKLTGSTGRRFRHVVVVGIGGSYLGTQFIATALAALADREIRVHYLSNVDINNFGQVASRIEPETTLWVIISKSYTTAETLANTRQAYRFMEKEGLDPGKHVVTVTSKGSPGDDPNNPVMETFHMYDFIGGRYSVTSAVGGVPLSLYLGYDRFERLLRGAECMDRHAVTAPAGKNLPLMAALLTVWNTSFLGYPAAAVIPYAAPLHRLPLHIQQLNMESNGKSVTADGADLPIPAGPILFGEPGTNAQHSFFQLAHQGRPFPIEFIGVLEPQFPEYRSISKGVTNHQELWANLIAQADALATGRESTERSRFFSGNRPSSTLVMKDISPESVGQLLSYYEAKTIFEGFLWGINPFDQFGVELGKTTASGIRREIAERNVNPSHTFDHLDPIPRFYLNSLFPKETDTKPPPMSHRTPDPKTGPCDPDR